MPDHPFMPARRFTPWLTRVLAVANVAVFATMALAGVDVMPPDALSYIDWGSNFAPLTVRGEWWRLASATLLHFGPVHLLFNSWALWAIGTPVERLFGHLRFGAIYLASGLAGSLASVAWNPLVNSAGASGAVFGIIGAQLAFFLRGGHRIPAELIRAQRNSTLGFIAYSVIFGFIVPGIDNAAHLGGLFTGTALGWALVRPLGVRPDRSRELAGSLLAVILAGIIAGGGYAAALRSARIHAAEQDWLLDWRWYARAEPGLVLSMNEVMTAASERRLDDAGVATWLEETGVPFYREASERLSSPALPANSPLAPERDRAVTFVEGRSATLELFARGLRERDRDKVEQAIAELSQGSEGPGDGIE